MKYVIMADGKGTRWNNYLDKPKHLIEVEGETLLKRTVRLIHDVDKDAEVIITSHNPEYEVEGAARYEPKNNVLEIDRFTEELVDDNVCFLYGDTFYSKEAMETIFNTKTDEIIFFGNEKSIVCVKIADGDIFRKHFIRVRNMFIKGECKTAKGWQVYRSYVGIDMEDRTICGSFIRIEDKTRDFNCPEDLK